MAAVTTQPSVPGPAPGLPDDAVAYEANRCFLPEPVCPECGSRHVTHNGTDRRNPQGRRPAGLAQTGPIRIQQYECQRDDCGAFFSPSLPFIEDGYRYTDELRQDVQAADLIYPATVDQHQAFATVRHGVSPSRTALDDWTHSDPSPHVDHAETDLVAVNDLPTYSGVYLLDEDWITIAGERWYRVTVYDVLMKAPVLEGLTDTSTNEAITAVIEPALRDKPLLAIVTDGRTGSATLVEAELGALQYRCGFHKVSNLREALWEGLGDDDLTDVEQIGARRICSEVCTLLTDHTRPDGLDHYGQMRDRFEAVLEEIEGEQVPEPLRSQVRSMEAAYDTFTAHHREPWLPGTINELENYYRHTQPTRVEHRFQSPERLLSFLAQQMRLWTVNHGLESRERSIDRARQLFEGLDDAAAEALFAAPKQRFLWWCDVWAG